MVPLPPDLSRLGDELTAAAVRALDERRRRRRLLVRGCASAISGLLTVAVLAPATLGPASRIDPLLARDADALIPRLPEHPPVTVRRGPHSRDVAAHRPAGAVFPSVTLRRDV